MAKRLDYIGRATGVGQLRLWAGEFRIESGARVY